ncbi:Sentrin-specific protease 2 [Labeo rohita]|uniref:Sentrin-specific protease 2 n=1 Tax=Labeo rohita TaxID=84645 RepID=A0A498MC34_LABRO|nr:Sentrin-specific protease 2 [Labeo rohita]
MNHVTATTTTYDHVREFYERDDISRQAPGMRDVVTVREGGVKKKIQKRHLTMSVLEAYRYFKNEHPESAIGKSKFAELRPSHVLRSSDTPRNVCLCRYHENIKLALDCLQHIIPRQAFQSTQDFVEAVACNPESPLCMLGQCAECRNGKLLEMRTLCNIPEDDKQIKATWYAWETKEGLPNKVQKTGTLSDVLNFLKTVATKFVHHCFVKKQQSGFFQAIKLQAKADQETVVLQVDFAENYIAAYQDQIQSAHWHQKQVTVFPSVLWSDGDPESYAIVSDSLEHDKRSVATFLSKIVEDIKMKHPAMKEIHIFSDGAASQFKNKFMWCFMSTTFKELFPTLRVQWHFFATSHGKGAVDGVGATVKRAVNTDFLCRQAVLVTDAASFVASARQSCPNINIKLITSSEITEFIQHHNLNERWANTSAVPGTQSVHHIEPVSWGEVCHKIYSEAEQSGVHTLLHSEITSAESPGHKSSEHQSTAAKNIKTGDCVLVQFKANKSFRQFVGLVNNQDQEALEIRFLRRNDSAGLVYILPVMEDKAWVTPDQVIETFTPKVDNRGRYHFGEAVFAE